MRDYAPTMLDELTATGEVIWSGHGTLPGRDGSVALHASDAADVTLAEPDDAAEFAQDVPRKIAFWGCLSFGGAYFAPQLSDMIRSANAGR